MYQLTCNYGQRREAGNGYAGALPTAYKVKLPSNQRLFCARARTITLISAKRVSTANLRGFERAIALHYRTVSNQS